MMQPSIQDPYSLQVPAKKQKVLNPLNTAMAWREHATPESSLSPASSVRSLRRQQKRMKMSQTLCDSFFP